MCLAVPAQIIRMADGVAICRLGCGQTTLQASLLLLPDPPSSGDYLIVHAGFALRVMDAAEAEETLCRLRVGQENAGTAVSSAAAPDLTAGIFRRN
mgnify:CR=1 FL=1